MHERCAHDDTATLVGMEQNGSQDLNLWDRCLWELGFAVCHQRPERLLRFGDNALFVCSRDTGIYVSFFTTLLLLSLLLGRERAGMPPLPLLFLSAAGVLFLFWEGVTSYLGLRESSNLLRFLSGYAAGAGLALPAAALINREVFHGDENRRVGAGLRELLPVALAALLALPVYLWRPEGLFRMGQLWLLVCMLGTLWSLNLLLVCLLKPVAGGGRLRSRMVVAASLVLVELTGSYILHGVLQGGGPELPALARAFFRLL